MILDCSGYLVRLRQGLVELEMVLLASADPDRQQRLALMFESRRRELDAIEEGES